MQAETSKAIEEDIFSERIKALQRIQAKWNDKKRETQIVLTEIANFLRADYYFLTTRDNETLYFYNEEENRWDEQGIQIVKERTMGLFSNLTVNNQNEIINRIKCETYFDRKRLNPAHLIGFENCVLDLSTWEIGPHRYDHYLTRNIPVTYNPNIFPSAFVKFLEEVVQEKDHQLVLEMMAHCLLNDYRFQKAFVIQGEGGNGKTTFVNVLIAFVGPENISSLTLINFQNNQFAASKLFGKLANIADDISRKGLRETQTFKILTGNGYGDYNVKGKQSITFRNTAKLIFTCNELPPIYEDTHAVWRRLCVINFVKTIPEEEQIEDLEIKLTAKEELSGILNVLLLALRRLIDRGKFEGLVSVMDTREQYIKKSDLVHAFCDNCLEYEDFNWVSTDELYREMCFYAEVIGQEPRTKRSLSDRLVMFKPKAYKAKGVEEGKRVRGWKGIRIINWREKIEN